MITTVILFSRFFFALEFGTAVAVSFAGMERAKKNYIVLGCFTIILYIIQVICLLNFGMDITIKIYPLLSHVPVAIFIKIYLKRSWLISLASMFISFLCCQPARWIGAVAGTIFKNSSIDHLTYIISVFLIYYLIDKFTVKSVRHMMERSVKSCLSFAAIPTFYYLFECIATVYTNLMDSGSRVAVQFMPFLTSAFYFVFVLIYYGETQKQASIQRERNMLDTQLRQAQIEFTSLRQMQQNAATYRHDMRHHFTLLQGLTTNGRLDEIKEYLRVAQSDIDSITPVRFCDNETVNLILSSFTNKAKQANVMMTSDIKLPYLIPFSDTELCSLLSNALENAIHACKKIPNVKNRIINMRMYSKNNKLCIDIRNSYLEEPSFNNGIPISNELGHGYGTKSMVYIIEKYAGLYRFALEDNLFLFQAIV